MYKSCLDGYLTGGCATCPDWVDGSDPSRGIGCACHFPIYLCGHFSKMMREEELKRKAEMVQCPHCGCYVEDNMFLDGFAICPFCEKEVEWHD